MRARGLGPWLLLDDTEWKALRGVCPLMFAIIVACCLGVGFDITDPGIYGLGIDPEIEDALLPIAV